GDRRALTRAHGPIGGLVGGVPSERPGRRAEVKAEPAGQLPPDGVGRLPPADSAGHSPHPPLEDVIGSGPAWPQAPTRWAPIRSVRATQVLPPTHGDSQDHGGDRRLAGRWRVSDELASCQRLPALPPLIVLGSPLSAAAGKSFRSNHLGSTVRSCWRERVEGS